jgi:hypothetical protein
MRGRYGQNFGGKVWTPKFGTKHTSDDLKSGVEIISNIEILIIGHKNA